VAVRPEALDLPEERALADAASAEDKLVMARAGLLQDACSRGDEPLRRALIGAGRLG
jgi:hypothetical protein